MYRTDYCGSLRREHIGRQATVCGWVLTRRDMGGVIFVDVRDREGTLQTVFDLSAVDTESFAAAERLRNQSVVQVTGEVRLRDESTYNAALPTGEVELVAGSLTVLSVAEALPFSPDGRRARARGAAPYVPLPRPAPPQDVRGAALPRPRAARGGADSGRAGLFAGGDAHPVQIHPGGRARLSGAQPRAPRHVLRPCRRARRFSSSF